MQVIETKTDDSLKTIETKTDKSISDIEKARENSVQIIHQKKEDMEEKVNTQSKIITEECKRAVEIIREEGDKGKIDLANFADTLERTLFTRITDDKEKQYIENKQSKYRSLILPLMYPLSVCQ
jgi:hypothetical protein